ncbi:MULTISPECIES: hypothetical protein [unclassified Micromonospora]|uniref:hypothetical protein n=1 Tax=unclassified Micromonospora TaxID=2617518 RepID=UPI0024756CDB|nr:MULTISPECIES: hypothetical protein [unclassified Micromonospora]WBB88422.1 hypothetical protein O7542_17180 [Micromonospora sp. WMMC264]
MPFCHRADPCSQAPAGVVVAALAAYLPLWVRPALPRSAPDTDQSWPLATGGRAVTGGQEQAILAVHILGLDGMCAGCRAWWARLTPYPCWQVEWATSRQARAITARFLEGVR